MMSRTEFELDKKWEQRFGLDTMPATYEEYIQGFKTPLEHYNGISG